MRSVTVVSLRHVFLLAALGLLSAISTGVSAQSVTATLPKVNFLSLPAGPYPSAPQTVGNFTYVPPPTITSATIAGTLGNVDNFSTAPVRVFLNGQLVATCLVVDPCNGSPSAPIPWSFSIPSSMFAQLAGGTATLTFIQDNAAFVRLGPTTLTLNGAVVATATPVPTVSAPLLAALIGLLAMAGAFAATRRGRGRS
jgi:hypothetical protein